MWTSQSSQHVFHTVHSRDLGIQPTRHQAMLLLMLFNLILNNVKTGNVIVPILKVWQLKCRYEIFCQDHKDNKWKIRIEIYVNMAHKFRSLKITSIGTFLVVQWLRLCAPNADGLCLILGQGTRASRPQLRDHMLQLRSGETK